MGTHAYGLFSRTRPSPAALIGVAGIIVYAASGVASAGGPVTAQPKMGEPLAGLTAGELAEFFTGKTAYNTDLLEAEGLGPAFNKESCAGCHNNPIGGTGTTTVTRFGTSGKGGFDPLGLGGSLLQDDAINDLCREEIPVPEATITQFRITNGMMGYGLVEAIHGYTADGGANSIQEYDTNPPVNPTSLIVEVSGHIHEVEPFEDPGNMHVGRFGWKAQVATILTFSADAANNEMGMTNAFLMDEQDPNGDDPPHLIDCDAVGDPEDNFALGNGVDKTFIEVVTDFQRRLAAPPQTPKSGMTGETHFANIGCADCHRPAYTTKNDLSLEEAIRNKAIRPYSDFLVHNMGLSGDPIVQGTAVEQEVKTPPLWGVRRRDPVWHNGSVGGGTFADRMTTAIGNHDAIGASLGARESSKRFFNVGGTVPGGLT
ncbi:MAG: di-heme oxidoredictase family protein, partial [Planctomycetota bacterium]